MAEITYPFVARREVNPQTNGDAVWVRLSAEERDVVHLDCKPNAHLTDSEALLAAVFIRHRDQPEALDAAFAKLEERESTDA